MKIRNDASLKTVDASTNQEAANVAAAVKEAIVSLSTALDAFYSRKDLKFDVESRSFAHAGLQALHELRRTVPMPYEEKSQAVQMTMEADYYSKGPIRR